MSWRIVPLLMLVAALAHFNRVSISVAGAEQIIRPGFINETEMGLVYSAFLVLYTLFMIPGGWFIDRFGPRAAWMVLGFGSAVGVALTGLVGLAFPGPASLLLGLLVVRSLLGMVNSPLHPSAARLVANWVPPAGAALANGLVTFAACVGIASTYVVFGLLMDRFGWPQAFLLTSGVTLLVALVWALAASNYPPGAGVPAPPPPVVAEAGKPWRWKEGIQANRPAVTEAPVAEDGDPSLAGPGAPVPSFSRVGFLALLGNPSLLCLTLSYGMLGYYQYLFFYWAQFYFERVLDLPKEVGRRDTS
jgi:MFS family permease